MEESFGVAMEKYFKFNSSHFVVCDEYREPLHGHNYKVSVSLDTKKLNSSHFVIDFDDLKPIMTQIVKSIHQKLLLPKANTLIKITEDGAQVNVK